MGAGRGETNKTLTALDDNRDSDWDLQRIVYLGWPLIRWVNQFFTINLFDWLTSWGLSMGLVLLLLTLIVKAIVYPFTYKSYVSSAKMRALKPYIDAIWADGFQQQDEPRKYI